MDLLPPRLRFLLLRLLLLLFLFWHVLRARALVLLLAQQLV
jgi:hypothetical protein